MPTTDRESAARPAVLILGAGGHGRVVLDILNLAGRYRAVGFLDNNPAIRGRRVDGLVVYGGIDDLPRFAAELDCAGVIVAIGDNGVRRGLARDAEQAGIRLINAIHPSAAIAGTARLGENVVVAAGAIIGANCQIGDSVILNTGAVVDHQTMIGEGAHVCPGARIAGRVIIESGAFVGIGATVIPKIRIGNEAIIGAGAVVIEDVPPLATAVGAPARTIDLMHASEDEVALVLPLRV